MHAVVNERWEVCVAVSEGQFQHVSFVNAISTSKGGTHVAHVTDKLAKDLVEMIQKKHKIKTLKPFQVRATLQPQRSKPDPDPYTLTLTLPLTHSMIL